MSSQVAGCLWITISPLFLFTLSFLFIIFLFVILDGFAQETPIQSPVSITMSRGNTDLKCHFKDFSGNFDNTVIHWYQQKENKAPVRMMYFTSGRTEVDASFQRHRYRIQTISTQRLCTLTIRNVIPDDAATYYCAYWDPHYGRCQTITSANTSSAVQPQIICHKTISTPMVWMSCSVRSPSI